VDSANLHEKGIASGVHYNCLHDLRVYLSYSFGIFPRSEEASKTVLSIPFHAGLSDDDVETVIKAVKEI
jgi:dTDP-4-amino-4,6-dideoxygalactose transaminase